MTGTIAQVTNNGKGVTGVARNVQIMPLKVLSAGGSGSVGGIADAIRFAADNGAKVINMSLGGPYPAKVLAKAVEYAVSKGVTVVCAAGNESRSKVGYPAAYPGAIAVSATQYDEDITFYSNYGKDIDIAAPGGNTRVDQNGDGMNDGVLQNTIEIGNPKKSGYYGFMGTSMASPHVAGVAALVVGEGITEPKMVEKVLKDSARKPGNGKKYTSDRYGAGIVDAPAAIKKARSQGGGIQFAFGLLLAGAVAASVRKRGVKLGWTYLAGTVVGASGLFFLPYIAPELSNAPVLYTLTHGLPSWDLSVLGPAGHGNALFFSALIPLALLAVGYGMPKLRAPRSASRPTCSCSRSSRSPRSTCPRCSASARSGSRSMQRSASVSRASRCAANDRRDLKPLRAPRAGAVFVSDELSAAQNIAPYRIRTFVTVPIDEGRRHCRDVRGRLRASGAAAYRWR